MKSFIGGYFGSLVDRPATTTPNPFRNNFCVLRPCDPANNCFFKINVNTLYTLIGNYVLTITTTPTNQNLTNSTNFFKLLTSDFFAKYTNTQIKSAKTIFKYSIRNTESDLKKRYFYIFRRFHYVWEKYIFMPPRELEAIDNTLEEEGEGHKPICTLNSLLTRILEYRVNPGFRLAKKFK